MALPHPSIIRSWYGTIDRRVAGGKVYCNLTLDEMSIGKLIEFDGSKYHGYVDIETGDSDDSMPPATYALVLVVVAINENWKIPIANFMINGLSGEEKANIVQTALIKVHEVGVIIPSITWDGPSFNFGMFKALGAALHSGIIKPTFPHPSNSDIKVIVLLDVSYMLKHVRNSFASIGELRNHKGEVIRWSFIEEWYSIQEKEGLRAGTKLRKAAH
uniref:DNA transposase THAP9like [Danio rerio] n=1 Tax=Lepeophtheirus salmonis TaxID=72036 RepID=A0A0K2UGI9_LEPSM